jgi:hypothetical protein
MTTGLAQYPASIHAPFDVFLSCMPLLLCWPWRVGMETAKNNNTLGSIGIFGGVNDLLGGTTVEYHHRCYGDAIAEVYMSWI